MNDFDQPKSGETAPPSTEKAPASEQTAAAEGQAQAAARKAAAKDREKAEAQSKKEDEEAIGALEKLLGEEGAENLQEGISSFGDTFTESLLEIAYTVLSEVQSGKLGMSLYFNAVSMALPIITSFATQENAPWALKLMKDPDKRQALEAGVGLKLKEGLNAKGETVVTFEFVEAQMDLVPPFHMMRFFDRYFSVDTTEKIITQLDDKEATLDVLYDEDFLQSIPKEEREMLELFLEGASAVIPEDESVFDAFEKKKRGQSITDKMHENVTHHELLEKSQDAARIQREKIKEEKTLEEQYGALHLGPLGMQGAALFRKKNVNLDAPFLQSIDESSDPELLRLKGFLDFCKQVRNGEITLTAEVLYNMFLSLKPEDTKTDGRSNFPTLDEFKAEWKDEDTEAFKASMLKLFADVGDMDQITVREFLVGLDRNYKKMLAFMQ